MEVCKLKDKDEMLQYLRMKDEERPLTTLGDDDHVSLPILLKSKGNPEDMLLKWGRKWVVTMALIVLTSSQGILIAWSKKMGSYPYTVTTANCLVEILKCVISVGLLIHTWRKEGITEDNKLTTTWDEVKVYPIPAALYLIKNLLQYYIFMYVDPPTYQILKNLNIITTGILFWLFLKRRLTQIQWAAFVLLALGCMTAQLNPSMNSVFQTPINGWIIAVMMAFLSGLAGVYTEVLIKKRPSRNINVQNFWLYVFGIIFNLVAMGTQDYERIVELGFFHGFSFIIVCMIVNHALSGIVVSMVMKYADNIVKVYSTSVAMLLTAMVSMVLFHFQWTLPFVLGCLMPKSSPQRTNHPPSGLGVGEKIAYTHWEALNSLSLSNTSP